MARRLNEAGFGPRLREARNKRGWSQVELGEKLGASRNSIAAWEKEVNEPSISTGAKAARLLGYTAGELMGDASFSAIESYPAYARFLDHSGLAKLMTNEERLVLEGLRFAIGAPTIRLYETLLIAIRHGLDFGETRDPAATADDVRRSAAAKAAELDDAVDE